MYLHYEDPQFDEEGQALYATFVIFEDNPQTNTRQLLTTQLQRHAAELALEGIVFELRETSIYINKSVSKEALFMFMNYGPPLKVGAPSPKTVTEEIVPNSKYL